MQRLPRFVLSFDLSIYKGLLKQRQACFYSTGWATTAFFCSAFPSPSINHTVRYCQIKTTPCAKRKDLLEIQTALRSGSNNLGELGGGLYRRGQAMGEGKSPWSLIICDINRWSRSICLACLVTGSS
jgi:hypothetical protein